MASVTDARGQTIETYAYDPVGRLTRKSDAKLQNETYRYDTAGNLTQITSTSAGITTRTEYEPGFPHRSSARCHRLRPGQ